MNLAVAYKDGKVFQHFGHSPAFKIYDIEDGRTVSSEVVPCGQNGHGALAGLLAQFNVEALICGGIGGGAQKALREAGIRLYGGVEGEADSAAESFARGTLKRTTRRASPRCGASVCRMAAFMSGTPRASFRRSHRQFRSSAWQERRDFAAMSRWRWAEGVSSSAAWSAALISSATPVSVCERES